MTNRNPKYTTIRGKLYWLHYKLPIALFNNTNLTSQLIRLSLNTKDSDKAGSLAQILVIKIQEYCKVTLPIDINKASLDDVIITTMINLGESTSKSIQRSVPKVKAMTISSAFEQYKNEMIKAELWRVKTLCDCSAAVDNLIELVGDIRLTTIDATRCREFKVKLMQYPLHRTKVNEFKGRSVIDIINSKESYPTISTTTVNNQIRKVNSFFNWLTRQRLLSSNPMIGMKIRQKVSLKAARSSFNLSDLNTIFSSAIYREHNFLHDYQFWLPLLALYSGARLEELCQLYLDDITLNSPTPYYRIGDEFEDQHIKNNCSRRSIPIHSELLELGFKKFIEHKRQQGEVKLFGYLVPQRQKFGHKPGQWFSKYKKSLDIKDTKKVFHSFRHTMVDSLKQIRAQDYEIKSLLGHQNGSVTHDIYGSIDTPIDSMYSMLNGLSFKNVTSKVIPWI
jgi:integrase